MNASFIRSNLFASTSSVQSATKKLLEDGFIIVDQNEYYVSDLFFQLYLIRIIGNTSI